MKSFDTELQKYAAKVRLRAAEREELREQLLSYMEYHPLPKERRESPTEVVRQSQPFASQPFIIIPWNALSMRLTAAALVAVFVVGVPLAAEHSVPGDALYLVKTNINENVGSVFAISPYQKIEFETRLIERRIAEARLLASEGKLTEAVEAEIAETVRGHAEAAQAGIAELKTTDADSGVIAEIAFSSVLDVQTAVLETESDVSGARATSTDSILDAVKVAQAESNAQKGDVAPSYDGLMAQVESETTRAVELLSAITDVVTDDERADIERRLADVDRKIESAQKDETRNTEVAIAKLGEALGLTQKLITFMTDIDVREHVALETLVPLELTVEERVASARILLDEVLGLRGAVESRLPTVTDPNVLEKVTIGLDALDAHIDTAKASLESAAVDVLELALTEAYALASDLDVMTQSAPESVTPDTDVVPETSESTPDTTDVVDETDTLPEPPSATSSTDGIVETQTP